MQVKTSEKGSTDFTGLPMGVYTTEMIKKLYSRVQEYLGSLRAVIVGAPKKVVKS